MRPFEFVLLLVIALTLCVYVIDKRRRPRWIGICAPVMLLIGVAQVLAEGPRWQMIPAYIIAGGLLLVWLFQTAGPARPGAAPMAHGRVAKVIATGLLKRFAIYVNRWGFSAESMCGSLPLGG